MKSKNNQQNTIEKTVIRFEKSETFKGSERNIRILKFLVDCYLKDIHVKESVLELELFGDSDQSVSYDGKVRVYMFNLRKKLDEYYRTEGANDSIIFEIQKGQYNLSIKQGTKTTKIRSKRINRFSIYAIIPLLIIISALIHTDFSPSYCWKPFIDKNDASLCCVGDHFII